MFNAAVSDVWPNRGPATVLVADGHLGNATPLRGPLDLAMYGLWANGANLFTKY